MAAARKVLVSDRLGVRPDSPSADTEVISRAQARERVGRLKAAPGPDLLVFGSHLLYNGLLAHGLVDELHLLVGNVLLGGGVPTFEPGVANGIAAELRLAVYVQPNPRSREPDRLVGAPAR